MNDESANESQRRAARETESKLALHGGVAKWPTFLLGPNEFTACTCGHHRTKHAFNGDIQRGACSTKKCECNAFTVPARKRE